MSFINIITTKKRESLLAFIASSFITLYKAHNKIETATVISATPLDESLRAEVINFIKKHGDNNVELTEKVDPTIIGGSIIRMGDKQLDTSVSKAISELRQIFNKNLYLQDF
jgi:F-type H+-transporting ATPase subunit delta